ncbi:hypothetical protein M8542_30665 [Amycolatopsis sp. OK19-0408]|uniref:Uncharacterized protein n=1 Tax=Amycolatopsis iheyensis TaxID=2945988 RepID=A0A9X2NEB6_9PSEU|nr:hypothetical protein [Amycolatopsis iheyensis]MCR6487201.1 hypothetical protein [Amycolatopsis iheyensis]
MNEQTWLNARQNLNAAVQSAIQETNPRFRLKGSFARGDFHLLRDGITTFSDIDLILPDDGRDRHAWEADVTRRMTTLGWPIRTSVQHFDTIGVVGAADSQLLALAELVRFDARRTEPFFDSYILAKTCLTLLHAAPPKQASPALRRSAELARRGFSTAFDAAWSIRLLRDLPDTPTLAHFRELASGHDVEGVRAWTIDRLKHSTVHPWLRRRMTEILEEAGS